VRRQASVSPELYQRLSKDDRSGLYERENDVTIAVSRRDEARLIVRATERRLDELSAQWRRCKERLERSNQSARIDGAEKLVDTHRSYLKDQLRIAEAHVDFRESEIIAARARLELQRQRQLVKSGLSGESSLESFESRAKDKEQTSKDLDHKEQELRADSQKRFLEWKAAESEYARASGDFDSLVWID
jgi:hypothetical protein